MSFINPFKTRKGETQDLRYTFAGEVAEAAERERVANEADPTMSYYWGGWRDAMWKLCRWLEGETHGATAVVQGNEAFQQWLELRKE